MSKEIQTKKGLEGCLLGCATRAALVGTTLLVAGALLVNNFSKQPLPLDSCPVPNPIIRQYPYGGDTFTNKLREQASTQPSFVFTKPELVINVDNGTWRLVFRDQMFRATKYSPGLSPTFAQTVTQDIPISEADATILSTASSIEKQSENDTNRWPITEALLGLVGILGTGILINNIGVKPGRWVVMMRQLFERTFPKKSNLANSPAVDSSNVPAKFINIQTAGNGGYTRRYTPSTRPMRPTDRKSTTTPLPNFTIGLKIDPTK